MLNKLLMSCAKLWLVCQIIESFGKLIFGIHGLIGLCDFGFSMWRGVPGGEEVQHSRWGASAPGAAKMVLLYYQAQLKLQLQLQLELS